MRKEVIVLVVLLVVISLIVYVGVLLVSAVMNSYSEDEHDYDVEIYVHKGWNLILNLDVFRDIPQIKSDSDITIEGVKSIFIYIPHLREYMESYPINRIGNSGPKFTEENEEGVLMQTPSWVYSDKKGYLRYKRKQFPRYSQVLFLKGWNFVTISPDMMGKSLENIKGNCNIEKKYWWSPRDQDWLVWNDEILRISDNSGLGFILKVSDDCNLEDNEDSVGPPLLPDIPSLDNRNHFFENEDYIIKKNFGNLSYRDINKEYEGLPAENIISAESISYGKNLIVLTLIGTYSANTESIFNNFINNLGNNYNVIFNYNQNIYEATRIDNPSYTVFLWYSENLILSFVFYKETFEYSINMRDVNNIINEYLNKYPSSL